MNITGVELVTLNDYADIPVTEPDWLIPQLIPREGLILLIGPPKAGKSFLALQVARDAAQGKPVLGRTPSSPVTSLYMQLDTSPRLWRIVTRALKDGGEDLRGPVYLVHPNSWTRLNILLDSDKARLRALINRTNAQLVILDVFREIHGLDENDSTAMKVVCDNLCVALRGTAILLIHHSRKIPPDVPEPDPMTYGRGSSYIVGKADSIWFLYKDKLRIIPRFDEGLTYRAVREESGFWRFPDLDEYQTKQAAVLALCAELPELPHSQVAIIARTRLNISRATFYRLLAGIVCAHSLQGSLPTR